MTRAGEESEGRGCCDKFVAFWIERATKEAVMVRTPLSLDDALMLPLARPLLVPLLAFVIAVKSSAVVVELFI